MDKNNDQKRMESGSNIFRRLICRQASGDLSLDTEKVPCNTPKSSLGSRADGSLNKMTSNSATNATGFSEEYVQDPSSILSLQPWIFKMDDSHINKENMNLSGGFSGRCGNQMNGFVDTSAVEVSPKCIKLGYGSARGRSFIRSKRSRRSSVKPLFSMENCLIPQLYNEKFEIEEYVFSSFSSPTTSMRPFVVTDGSKIISKSSYEPLSASVDTILQEVDRESSRVVETVVGMSPLPEIRKSKRKSRDIQHSRLGISNSQRMTKYSHSQGSLDGMFLFSIGVTIGVLSSVLSNKREVQKLSDMLKRTENLVQDLQEELDMKESLTVNEVIHEASRNAEGEQNQPQTTEGESMSKIEAELQAELERLELNMNANSLEGRISALGEVEQEFIGDVIHGELRANVLDCGDDTSEDDHDQDSKSSSTGCAHDVNYVVSPTELSLRLHEVIQHRLEERIKELEISLAQSQKQLQRMEAERIFLEGPFSNSDMGSSSNQESPTLMRRDSPLVSQPFCLNLSGDALNAYDEAYEEFMRIANSEGNMLSATNVIEVAPTDESYPSDRSLLWGMEDGAESKLTTSAKHFERAALSESDGDMEDEYYDDESKMLIQQIVERTRKGSPAVIHAQKILFSVDD
ncbi:uncharacterized protein [Typha latifolia]|uniref:uncharacterized protein n=1 Tax=Typha latifolia TaxID=4733 RepID=UPI003C2CE49B